jgi:hypothetical protein
MPGPKGLLQEKFQQTVEQEPPEDHEWANMSYGDSTPIRKIYKPNPETYYHVKSGAGADADIHDAQFNYMPPGMFIDNQEPPVTERAYKHVAAGSTDVSDQVDSKMMRKGFTLDPMSPVEDMFNNEHVEEFYGEVKGDDDAGNQVTGFAERNNYLDRN